MSVRDYKQALDDAIKLFLSYDENITWRREYIIRKLRELKSGENE